VAFDPLSINVGVNSMMKAIYIGIGFKTKWNFFVFIRRLRIILSFV
jgi:hypothetical protein